MEIAVKVAQFVLSLSILILLHEMGHFFAARLFKTRVEKFYLFFDIGFSLFKIKRKDTEYGIGWLPLGGYVKIAGMIDESLDKEQLKQEPQPWEFRTKKTWQRLIIMIAGVVVNFILPIFIWTFLLWINGEQYLPTKEAKYGIAVDSLGTSIGLRNGDNILSIDGEPVEDFMKIATTMILEEAKTIQISRDGENKEIVLPSGFLNKLTKTQKAGFITPRIPFEVASFSENSVGQAAGIKEKDVIIGLNDSIIPYFNDFRNAILTQKDKNVDVVLLRGKDTMRVPVKVPNTGLLGISPNQDLSKFFAINTRTYGFFEAIPAGAVRTGEMIVSYWKQLKLLFSPEVKAYQSIGGFMSIGSIFPGQWDWTAFWSLTAFLSIMLAILNILPIPALDGGHVLFLIIEMITGRKPSEKVLIIAQYIGLGLLLLLFLWANINDVLRFF